MEPRPTRSSSAVSQDAARRIVEALNAVAGCEVFGPHSVPAVQGAISQSEDAFERGLILHRAGWDVTQEVVSVLDRQAGHERFALVEAEQAWAMRAGARFPAKEGDRVIVAVNYVYLQAVVVAVRGAQARALVRLEKGQGDGATHDVPAEHVIKVRRGEEWVAVRSRAA